MRASSHRPVAFLAALLALPSLLLLTAPSARADTIELRDGRFVEGMIVPDKHPEHGPGVYVISRFGPTFIKQADIKARHEGKAVDEQIKEYIAALDKRAKDGTRDIPNRLRLADWMMQLGRVEEGRELVAQILEWEPENPKAHKLLGHVRYRGQWITHDEAQRKRGLVKHGDTWYTPQEWENLATAEKRKAAEAEQRAAERARQAALNKAVRLALSPDPAVRARGKARLLAMGKEKAYDQAKVEKLVADIDDYLRTIEELRRKAASVGGGVGVTSGGMVMGEIRATFAKLKRPIPVFQTNLASGPIGANAPVSLQLPELEVIRVNTTMAIPALVDD